MNGGPHKWRGPLMLLRESHKARWALVAFMIGCVLYVLSSGPAIWLVESGLVSRRFAQTILDPIYIPLFKFFEGPHNRAREVLDDIYWGYLRLWRVPAPVPPVPVGPPPSNPDADP